MEELQAQLTTLHGMLDRAERYGLPVVDIQRRITEVNSQLYTLQELQRNAAAILSNAPRCQIEPDGDMLWA